MHHQRLACSRGAGGLPPSHQKQHRKGVCGLAPSRTACQSNAISFFCWRAAKAKTARPGALKAEGPDAALGRVFILAGAKKNNAFFRAELNSGT